MYNQGHGQRLYPTKPNVIGQRRYPTKVIQQRLSSIMLIKDYIPPMSSDKKVYHQDYIPQRLRIIFHQGHLTKTINHQGHRTKVIYKQDHRKPPTKIIFMYHQGHRQNLHITKVIK